MLKGNREKGLAFLGFHVKASYYDYGRQLGREKINDTAREALPELLKNIKLFTFAEKVTLMKVYKIKKDIDNLNMYMENCHIY